MTRRGDEPAGRGGALREAVRARRDEWLDLLVRVATFESPSGVPAGIRAVRDLVAEELEEVGFRVRRVERGSPGVPCLLAAPRSRRKGPYQLLLGHMDTVWPLGTLRAMPLRVEGGAVHGPGVFDMKAGIANLVVALRTLRDLGREPTLPPVVFLSGDEETGSHATTPVVRRLAKRAARAFVLEPAEGPEGRLKTARKGHGVFILRVTGRSAHAGLHPEAGASAVHEIALQIERIAALSDPAPGVTLNVGTVAGGTRANVIAESATAEVDLRFDTLEEGERVAAHLGALEAITAGCRVEISGRIERPPFEPTPRNRALWEAVRETAAAMGVPVEEARVGGVSDGNTASLHTATLDGLGAVGGGAHARDEHARIAATLDRAALLARLLLLPADVAGEGAP